MIHAYDGLLLSRTENLIGHMLDFSVHSLHIDIRTMMKLFSASGIASLAGQGDVRIICGMSGAELAYEVLERSGLSHERVPQRHTISLSAEYWAGCALAAIQYGTGLSFDRIMRDFDAAGFISGYTASRTAFLDHLPPDISEEDRIAAARAFGRDYVNGFVSGFTPGISEKTSHEGEACPAEGSLTGSASESSPLKAMRIKNGLSQSALAKASGIPVRTIQQYEQRQKSLCKARAEYLMALAYALHCDPSSLLE